jgi:hypothetical protein
VPVVYVLQHGIDQRVLGFFQNAPSPEDRQLGKPDRNVFVVEVHLGVEWKSLSQEPVVLVGIHQRHRRLPSSLDDRDVARQNVVEH